MFIIYNSTNRLQGALRASPEGLPEDDVLTSKHVAANHM